MSTGLNIVAERAKAGPISTPQWLLVVILMSLGPVPGQGQVWDYTPFGSVGAVYESNPRSSTDNALEDDAYAGIVSGTLSVRGETRTTRLTFRPQFRAAAYTGAENASDLNYVDYHMPLGIQKSTQVALYSLRAGYDKSSTRSFPSVNPNDPGQNPANRPQIDEYQERWSLDPSGSWQATARDLLSVTASYDDVSYTEAERTSRSEYQVASSGVTWTRTLTPQNRISLSTSIDAFFSEIPGTLIENDSVSYGMTVGYDYSWSATTSLGASAGAARTDVAVKGLPFISTPSGPLPCLDPTQNIFVPCELKTTDNNFIGQVFLRQQSAETITTEVSVSRSIQPNSDGAQVTLDVARVYLTKNLGPMLSGSAGASYSSQKAVGEDTVDGRIGRRFSREYWSAEASLGWRLARQWTLKADYSYYRDEQTAGITYTIPRHRLNINIQFAGLGSH